MSAGFMEKGFDMNDKKFNSELSRTLNEAMEANPKMLPYLRVPKAINCPKTLTASQWIALRRAVERNIDSLRKQTVSKCVAILAADGVKCNADHLNGLQTDLHVWKKPQAI